MPINLWAFLKVIKIFSKISLAKFANKEINRKLAYVFIIVIILFMLLFIMLVQSTNLSSSTIIGFNKVKDKERADLLRNYAKSKSKWNNK